MATAAEVQTAYKAINRADLNATVAQSIADAINNGSTTLETYIAGQIAATNSTTGAAVAIASFITGVTPTSEKLTALKAEADKQVASYAALKVGNPALGAFEAFGKGFAADSTTGFATKYGALSTADFINAVYFQVYGTNPSAGAFANLSSQITYFTNLYTGAGIPAADAALQAKGAVLGQIVGYAFVSEAASVASIDNQVATFLTNAAKGDTTGFGKALPSVPTNVGSTFALTSAIDVLKGTAGNDTFIGDNTGLQPSIQPGDTIDGGLGADRANLFLAGAAGTPVTFNTTSVEQFYTQAIADAQTLVASNFVGATEFWTSKSTAALTVTEVQNLAAVGVQGGRTAANGDPVDNYTVQFKTGVAGAGVALDVLLDGGANVNELRVGDASGAQDFGTINIKATGGSAQIGDIKDGNGANSDTAKVVITGDSRVSINGVLDNVTSIDASASTGGARVVIDTTKNVTFVGSAAADRVDIGAAGLDSNDKIDGGAGTDTLRTGQAISLVTGANIKGFEILEVRGGITQNIDNIIANNALTGITISGGNFSPTINNINDGALANLRFTADETATATFTAKNFLAGGTSDAATIFLDNSATKAVNGIDIGTLNFANLDALTLNVISDGSQSNAELASINNLVAADLEKITVVGDNGLILTAGAGTGPTEVDASALKINTGNIGLVLNLSADNVGAGALVRGTSGNDTVLGTTGTAAGGATSGDTFVLGAGSDFGSFGGQNGLVDAIVYTATSLNSGDVLATDVDTYAGFNAGDTLKFDVGIFNGLKVANQTLGSLNANIVLGNGLNALNNVAAVTVGNDLQIQIDLNGDGVYTGAADFAINLQGQAGATVVYDAVNKQFVLGNANIVAGNIQGQTLTGTNGNDTINGNTSDETIIGGGGADTLRGGGGLDTFVFANRADTRGPAFAVTDTTTANIDKIVDFFGNGAAAGDSIQLGTGANAFGAALQFTGATAANVTAITVANAANFTDLAAGAEAVTAGTASTAGTARIYDITVTAGAWLAVI